MTNPSPQAGEGLRQAQSESVAPTPLSSRRQVFGELRRALSEDDLSSSGVHKMLLDELERAEAECALLSAYVERYHEADKRAAVLEERARPQTALEIAFGAGLGLGGAIIGLAPLFWTDQPKGWIALLVGLLMMVAATIARAVKK